MLNEEQVLDFWNKQKIFEKSLDKSDSAGTYTFYDGPPFATGLPHYGHILASTIKDAVPRYQTMLGNKVIRRWGWDCHGLPIENIVEKDLHISGKKEIESYGIGKFNDYAQSKVLTYIHDWKKTVDRIGRWVDFDGSYKTMDTTYIESVWWAFKEMNEKNLVYRSTRVLPYCPRCETPIANSEIAMDNSYKDITDISVYVELELVSQPGTYLLVWTTTPWTLPGNTAVAVNPATKYVKVKGTYGDRKTNKEMTKTYIVAKDLLEKVQKFFAENKIEIVGELMGDDLVGEKYQPIFPYYVHSNIKNKENGWQVYAGDYVTTESGTGLVHLAPCYGEEDMLLAQQFNIPQISHVGPDGKMVKEVLDFAGLLAKPKENHQSTDIEIIKYLAHHDLLFAKEKVIHSYPHCFRCETPLYYYALPAWFIKISQVKDDLLRLNGKINWIPDHLKNGRFAKSVAAAPDWNISRTRYWASPLPIWQCDKCHENIFIGSIKELKEKSTNFNEIWPNENEVDLHRPHIDKVVIKCGCGGFAMRIPEVFDCWFESGSMPFAQNHYPFENKDFFNQHFPAQFVTEYIAQTRTWFYYMHVVSTILFESNPFENVVTTGTVLAEDGQKMSKSKGNYPDPWLLINQYGADALRFYLLSSPIMRSQDMNFSESGVGDVYRKVIMRLKNIVSFCKLYDNGKEIDFSSQSKNVLDIWIKTRLNEVLEQTTQAMNDYHIDLALRPIDGFIEDLSIWYLRRSRDRLKKIGSSDQKQALETFKIILLQLAKICAPFIPFISESIYLELKFSGQKESVHLEDWPIPIDVNQDDRVIDQMTKIRKLVSLALEVRKENNLKVRQPLAQLIIQDSSLAGDNSDQLLDLLAQEINVKKIVVDSKIKSEIELDINLNDELIKEGLVRDIIRLVQDARKKAGYGVDQHALVVIQLEDGLELTEESQKIIEQETQTKIVDHIDQIDGQVSTAQIKVDVGK